MKSPTEACSATPFASGRLHEADVAWSSLGEKGQDLDPQLVRQTKQLIGNCIVELASLAKSSMMEEEFYPRFLNKAIEALGARGAALWEYQQEERTWSCRAHSNLPSQLFANVENPLTSSDEHAAVLLHALQERQPAVVPPRHVRTTSMRPVNPTDELLILCPIPIQYDSRPLWLELVQPPVGGPATQRGYLRFALQLSELIANYLHAFRLTQLERSQQDQRSLDSILTRLSNKRTPSEHLRDLIDTLAVSTRVDQIFLVHERNGRWHVAGASGLKVVDPKSLGCEVVSSATQEIFASPEKVQEDMIEVTHHSVKGEHVGALMSLFGSNRLAWIPVNESKQNRPNVCLVLHWQSEEKFSGSIERTRSMVRIGLQIIRPTWWKRIAANDERGYFNWLRLSHQSAWTKCIVAMLGTTLIALIPFPISLVESGTLLPSQVENFYAPSDATITSIHFDHGDTIAEGETLLALTDHQLSATFEDSIGIQSKNRQQLREIETRLMRAESLPTLQRDQLEGERQMLLKNLDFQKTRIDLLQKQMNRLEIRASHRGKVATWDLKRQLEGRPVKSGQLLATIYQPDGGWYVDAEFPERDTQALREASHSSLQATLVLASDPLRVIPLQLLDTGHRAYTSTSAPNEKRARLRFVVLDRPAEEFKVGSVGRVQLDLGRKPLYWVLFRDLILTSYAKLRLWI